MKTLVTSIALALAASASHALVFDFHWSSEGASGHGADPVTAMGTIEIDANAGETFSLPDIVASDIAVTGPDLAAFGITSWTSAGGSIAADGLSAMFSGAGNPFSSNVTFFGCEFFGCAGGTFLIEDAEANVFLFDFGDAESALASMKMTRDDGMAPVPLPAGGLLLIGALGALSLVRRRT